MSELLPPDDVERALRGLGVTDATLAALTVYVETLEKWRKKINLIGPASVEEVWRRHVLDSAQAWPLITDPKQSILDLGAGAGFPGLVLDIMGAEDVTMVDSDQRKAVFLREAARAAGVNPRIIPQRFDAALAAEQRRYGVVTARAVARLEGLLPVLERALEPDGYAVLHKGAQADEELTEARKSWTMQSTAHPSITGGGGVLLKIWGIRRRDTGS
ncbi:MAG: 16S rRNA (guanine(527)-N(7))-methyltransferase RsmG [Alphaproteobacteria bacterium]